MKSMHRAVCLVSNPCIVLGLNPMSVIAVKVRTDAKPPCAAYD